MRFCAILILSVISILNSLELKSQTVVKILSNGCKVGNYSAILFMVNSVSALT